MTGFTQLPARNVTPSANECSHYASQAELVAAIREASGRECFATYRCFACSDIHCQWCPDCQQLSGLLFRFQ
jgi:hypothetical protein